MTLFSKNDVSGSGADILAEFLPVFGLVVINTALDLVIDVDAVD